MFGIGIGCFWFAARSRSHHIDDGFDFKRHLAHVKSALEQIDSVANVLIVGDDRISIQGFSYRREAGDTNNLFPMFIYLDIDFDIYMPYRLQRQYGSIFGDDLEFNNDVESFHVKVRYGREFPVVFVSYPVKKDEYRNPEEERPSRSIIFIRKYLEEKLRNHPDVEFQMLGPSPMHVNIIVENSDKNQDIAPLINIENIIGYKSMIFRFKTEYNIIDSFIKLYCDQIGTFYRLVLFQNNASSRFASITNIAYSLVSDDLKRKSIKKFIPFGGEGSKIKKVYSEIFEAKISEMEMESYVRSCRRDQLMSTSQPFTLFINDLVQDFPVLPLTEIRELLSVNEQRRLKHISDAVAVFSAICGGVIGSLITLAAGGHH